MKKILIAILIATLILTLLISGISCSATPTDKSWDSPEEFVLYDVERYVSIALENDQKYLVEEYGKELAEPGDMIWVTYSLTGNKPTITDIERFADGCWATVTGVVYGGGVVFDESVFYYGYYRDKWQLAYIGVKLYGEGGITIYEHEFKRDIDYK